MDPNTVLKIFEEDKKIWYQLQVAQRILEEDVTQPNILTGFPECQREQARSLFYLSKVPSLQEKTLSPTELRKHIDDYVSPYLPKPFTDETHYKLYSIYLKTADTVTVSSLSPITRLDYWNFLAFQYVKSPYATGLSERELNLQLQTFFYHAVDPERAIHIVKAGKARDLDEIIECSLLQLPHSQVLKRLGRGSFKRVYLGIRDIDLRLEDATAEQYYIAVKVFDPGQKGLDIMSLREQDLHQLAQCELRVKLERVFAISNFNINGILDGFKTESGLIITYEPFCNGGSLLDYDSRLRENRPIPYKIAGDYIWQIAHGCKGLIQLGILPVDLKFQNILVHTSGKKTQLRLTDFESNPLLSDLKKASRFVNVGYPLTMAPELLCTSEVPTVQSMYWSLGMLYFKMLTGKSLVPFHQPLGWTDMTIERRGKEYDQLIKKTLLRFGQEGINERINRLEMVLKDKELEFAKRELGALLRFNPGERVNLFW